MIEKAQGRPLLFSYGADSTPLPALLSKVTQSFEVAGSVHHRQAGTAVDFLAQIGFLKARTASGDTVIGCLASPPRALSAGKSSWNCFTAQGEFFPHLRRLVPKGIIVQHCAFDRALFSAMERLERAQMG